MHSTKLALLVFLIFSFSGTALAADSIKPGL